MNTAQCFKASYAEARENFLSAVAGAKGELEAVRHPAKGPDGRELFTDVAWFGPRDALCVLTLISGTHGVEGFCGSGAQISFLLSQDFNGRANHVAVLLIHAINPHGFAWLRRVTHENIDLNRNWIDFSRPLPENKGYAELATAICPEEWTDEARARADSVLDDYSAAHGNSALVLAVSGGQHQFPLGVYYGGVGPSWSRELQTRIFEHWLGQAQRVAIIDFHSGLGSCGMGDQLVAAHSNTPEFTRARSWYGAAVKSIPDGASAVNVLGGDGLSAAPRLLTRSEVTAIALEFGTLERREVRAALRADAWLHAYGDPNSSQGQDIKRQIREAFYVDTDEWKGMVAGQSILSCRQALAGLSARA